MRTVCGSEFQIDGSENRKASLEMSVLVNGWSSSGMADERLFWCVFIRSKFYLDIYFSI